MSDPLSFLKSLKIKGKKKKLKKKCVPFFVSPKRNKSELTSKKMTNDFKYPPNYKPQKFVQNSLPTTLQDISTSSLQPLQSFLQFDSLQIENIKSHTGIITSIQLDKKGSRLYTGGTDYRIKIWDFHSAGFPIRPFREPVNEVGDPIMGNYPINQISYNHIKGVFICAANYCKFKIFDMNGRFLAESLRGDMYIRDKRKTKGHIAAINDVVWHPNLHQSLLTCSIDGTLRLWDANYCHRGNFAVVRTVGWQKKYVSCTSCDFHPSGNAFLGAVDNGKIYVFSTKGPFDKPIKIINNSHTEYASVSRIRCMNDGIHIITRGKGDADLKVWDWRKMEKPLKIFSNLPNKYDQTEVFCDDNFIFTGTSQMSKKSFGELVVIEKKNLKITSRKQFPCSIVRIEKSNKINQMFLGCSDNLIRVLYDPKLSKRGILYSLGKKGKKVHVETLQNPVEVFNPHALSMYRKREAKGTRWAKNRRDPKISHLPEQPQSGVGVGGRLGTSQNEQYLKEMGIQKDPSALFKDPRRELWAVAEETKKNPQYITKAYEKNQPITILVSGETKELKRKREEEDDFDKRFSKKRKFNE